MLLTASGLPAGGPSPNHVVAVRIPASTWPSLCKVSEKECKSQGIIAMAC